MTFSGVVLIILLCAVTLLSLVLAGVLAQVKSWRESALEARAQRDALAAEVTRLREQAAKVQKIEEVRDERKDTVAAGGFDASVSVLSDIARRGKPKA